MRPHHSYQEVQPLAQKNQLGGRFQDTLRVDNEPLPPQGKNCITRMISEISLIMMNQKKIIQVMHQENIRGQHPSHDPRQHLLANEGAIFPAKRQPAQPHHPPTRTGPQAKNRACRLQEHKTPKGIL